MPNPSTPPNSQEADSRPLLSDTTPLKRDISGSEAHSSTPPKKAPDRYADMTFDTCEKFVGPMPVKIFLQEFIPEAPIPRPKGDVTLSQSSVSQNEDEFIEAIRESELCPDLHFMNTTSRSSEAYPLKPDISVFSRAPNLGSAIEQPATLDWGLVELWIENKPKANDPFIKIEELQKNADVVSAHVGWTVKAYKTCGQLIAYATALHRSQFRVFAFSIVLFGDTGRLLRWDRSGVIYTAPFKWAKGNLFEFLWRFNHLSAVDRGHDTTVTRAKDDEAEVALPKLRTYPKFENVQKDHLHRILVWNDRAPDEEPRRYITPSAKWATEALIGRATFGYIAYEIESGNLVYLKDFWRSDHAEVQKEGDVYHELHEAEVSNIAKMGRAGDVPLQPDGDKLQISPRVQRTRTQDYLSRRGSQHSWCPGHPRVEPYIHYRLVLETVGMSLNRFKSTRQLCEVVRDAIVAHTAAYNKARILHRDVSAGNILITDKGSGILIDWDLSKKVREDRDLKARRHSRTGTWQFISIARLLDPWSRPHEVSDDLESFFWVLLYEVFRYRNTSRMNLKTSMQEVFDYHTPRDSAGVVRGGNGKLTCLGNYQLSSVFVRDLVETPCSEIIEEMRSLFHDFYLHMQAGELSSRIRSAIQAGRERDPRVQNACEKLNSSDELLAIMNRHLASTWDIDNDGSLDLSEPRANPSASRNRRKRKAGDNEDSEQNIHLRRIGRMPPGLEQKSRNELSSQTSLTPSNRENLFSNPSRMHSSSSALPSSSLRSRDDDSSAS